MMQRWQEEFVKHPIHTTLKRLEDVASKDFNDIDAASQIEKARFLKVVLSMKAAVNNIDQDFAPIDILSQLNNNINSHSVLNTINSIEQTSNAVQFANANDQISSCISYIYQLNYNKRTKQATHVEFKSANNAFNGFANSIDYKLKSITAKELDYSQKVDRNLVLLDNYQQKFEEWDGKLNSLQSDIKDGALDVLEAQNASFNKLLTDNESSFNEWLSRTKVGSESKLSSFFDESTAHIKLKNTQFEEILTAYIKNSEEKNTQIEKFYDLTAHNSVTGGYKSIADREYESAQFWRKATIACIIVTVVWLVISLACWKPDLEPAKLFWTQIIKGFSLTALLLSVTVYASRQSTLHRANERKARAFFLQVQAFDPFISKLPEANQVALKEELSKRIFGSEVDIDENQLMRKAEFQGAEKVMGLLKDLIKVIGK